MIWDKASLLASPLFEALHPVIPRLGQGRFPDLSDLNALLLRQPVRVLSGLPLCCVAQEHGRLAFSEQYEPRCYLKGELQVRADNWHDLLNVLVWMAFPKAKAALNARHYEALQAQVGIAPHTGRGAIRDMATLFDESGVVVACADAELAALLRGFKWHELFWQQRDRIQAAMGFFVCGHGLLEKSMQPYVGITGQGLVLDVEPSFFGWPLTRRLAHLDALLAGYLCAGEHCRSTRELTPVPLLGVPGWSKENAQESYYANTGYFRPGRAGRAGLK